MFLVHVANKVVFSTDVVVVGIVLGPVAATLYAIPAKLFSLAFGLSSAATNLTLPRLRGVRGRRRDGARSGGCCSPACAADRPSRALLALPLLLMPDQLIQAWVGDGYAESTPVLALLAVVAFVHQPVYLLTQYLTARGLPARASRGR